MGADIQMMRLHNTKHEDEVGRISRNFFKARDLDEGLFNSCDHVTYLTGGEAPAHVHEDTEEVFYVIRGTGVIILNGKEIPVKAGSVVTVPPGAVHAVRNTGQDILQHVVCSAHV